MNFRKLVYTYFSRRTLPYWGIVIIDLAFVFFSLFINYFLNQGLTNTISHFWPLCYTLGLYTATFLIGFRLFHTYSGIIRYSSFVDLQRVALATFISMSLSLVMKYTFMSEPPFVKMNARVIILGAMVATLLMWWMRVAVKYVYENYYTRRSAEKVFIFGVREGGISIAKSLKSQEPVKYVLAGFTSERPAGKGKVLMGVKVYPFDENLADEMVKAGAKALFVSPLRSETLRNHQDIVSQLISKGIKLFMMPEEERWDGSSELRHNKMREVKIEDLLPRQQIEVDLVEIQRMLNSRRILITGAAGSIGSEICRQVAISGPGAMMLIDQAETPLHDIRLMMSKEYADIKAQTVVADISCKTRMRQIFEEFRPQYVFHAAAYKHVPMMEDNPGESIRNNVEGTRIIADLSVEFGVEKFVMVSTDKAVNPTNVMGCSKRICEIYVQSLDKAEKEGAIVGKTQFVTTRFGNVLGSNGSVIPLFREQIKNGGPVTVTHPDIIRYFMLIPEACKLVLEAGTMGHGGEIFVFDMGEPVKIVDLAKRMIKLSGREDIEIRFTGLRDGEKLYEEVLNEKETTLPTFHPKIKIAKVREYDYDVVNKDIDTLNDRADDGDAMEIVRKMKEMVPEFKSQNSIYEKLDK